jgi:UDP-N-acetylglucosamine 1-carboxyvinyltransferase
MQFKMRGISVGATANIMMAAVLARGKTVLENCAREPDVVDLGNFLVKMGAKISGLGSDLIEIEGVKRLEPVSYSIIPDRIEAGTYLIAGAATKGEITIKSAVPEHIAACMDALTDMGFVVDSGADWVSVKTSLKLSGTLVKTLPYPGFPTDLQAPMMALSATIPGINVIVETIFENRFTHVAELRRMGADITVEGNVVIVKGVEKLSSAPIMMSDLRAGAALVIAGLIAEGETEIRRIYHCDRGYERLENKLSVLGADIRRVKGGGL